MTRLDQNHGTLTLHTGVTGAASRMGHRLTIDMQSWRAEINWTDGTPTAAALVVDVDSLRVTAGAGGMTPLTTPEKALARGNALKTLDAKRFPTIEFRAETITATDGGYLLRGPLTIHGKTAPADVEVSTEETADGLQLSVEHDVSHKAFGIKPYSMAMGAMKVADAVTVAFTATVPAG